MAAEPKAGGDVLEVVGCLTPTHPSGQQCPSAAHRYWPHKLTGGEVVMEPVCYHHYGVLSAKAKTILNPTRR